MRKFMPYLLLLAILTLAACAPPAEPATPTSPPPPTEAPTEPPTATAIPSNTPLPPTETPVPTATLVPSITPYAGAPRIVFSSTRGDDPTKLGLYLMDLETKEITPIETDIDVNLLPKWSPDGNMISFANPEPWSIYTIYADGSEQTQVTDFSSNNADWAPDGKHLVFQSDSQNEPKDTPDIYMIDISGENLVEILDAPEIADYNPRWSPVEDKILFVSRKSGKDELWTINTDGSELTQVTESKNPVTEGAWAPGGERFVFAYGGFGVTDLYAVDIDGTSNVVRLTNNKKTNRSASYSPDGSQIVFSSNVSGNWDLWLINADGSGLTQLTDDEFFDDYPDWCPR